MYNICTKSCDHILCIIHVLGVVITYSDTCTRSCDHIRCMIHILGVVITYWNSESVKWSIANDLSLTRNSIEVVDIDLLEHRKRVIVLEIIGSHYRLFATFQDLDRSSSWRIPFSDSGEYDGPGDWRPFEWELGKPPSKAEIDSFIEHVADMESLVYQ